MLAVLKRVFREPRYALATTALFASVLSLILLIPYTDIITQVLFSGATLQTKLTFIFSLYGTLQSKFTLLGMINILLLSLLFAVNVALLVFYIRRRKMVGGSVGIQAAGVAGMVAGLFGIGCAACGSVIVTAFLALFSAGGLLLLLPFGGAEFGVFGLVMLLVSIGFLIKRIRDPLVCPTGKG